MTEFAMGLIAIGIVATFSITAGLISIKLAEHIIEEADKMEEKDHVYMEDGTPVEYNEDDQE